MSTPADTNAQQIAYWNDEAGPKWVALQERLDAQLEPFGRLVIDRLAPAPGERVLDVGCGCGATTRALAARVGAGGAAVGLDVSGPMLAHARALSRTEPAPTFVQADATTFRAEPFDAVASRFGVMFFADPVAAFTNLHALLRAGGRLAFICWQGFETNQWVSVPMLAALPFITPLPPPPPPRAPGPFAFAEADYVRDILGRAGFVDVALEPQALVTSVGGRGASLEEASEFLLQMGPTARMLANVDADTRTRIAAAVRDAIAPFHDDDGVRMGSASWLVSARRA